MGRGPSPNPHLKSPWMRKKLFACLLLSPVLNRRVVPKSWLELGWTQMGTGTLLGPCSIPGRAGCSRVEFCMWSFPGHARDVGAQTELPRPAAAARGPGTPRGLLPAVCSSTGRAASPGPRPVRHQRAPGQNRIARARLSEGSSSKHLEPHIWAALPWLCPARIAAVPAKLSSAEPRGSRGSP